MSSWQGQAGMRAGTGPIGPGPRSGPGSGIGLLAVIAICTAGLGVADVPASKWQ